MHEIAELAQAFHTQFILGNHGQVLEELDCVARERPEITPLLMAYIMRLFDDYADQKSLFIQLLEADSF